MSFFLPPLPPKWSAALRDVTAQRTDSRIAAARRLGQPVDAAQATEALAGLRQLSGDREGRVRAAAIEALNALVENGDGVSRESVSDVLRARLSDSDPSVREIATVGLADLGWNVAAPALTEALRSEYPEVRFQALSAAAQSGADGTADQILTLLDDPDPFVRTAAVRAAGMIAPGTRPDSITSKLRAALRDSAYPVRCEAGIALAEEGEREAADALLVALSDPQHLLDALDVAPLLPDERVREKVAFMAGAVLGSRLIVAAAGRALARMKDPRGIQVLRDLLTGFRTQGRTLAVQTIGELRLSDLTGDLIRLSERPRAVDPTALAATLAILAEAAPTASRALEVLSNRRDEYGQAARTALAEDSRLRA
ncbi:MAG TPA: HEAT repeat domain-containing protein [Polyangiales bacterium]|nr:HEAT repeat domain-containing protein [Polyangiales bacterium]